MSQEEGTTPKFAVGSAVRVKKGITAPNHPDVPLSGRHGVVSQVSGAICLVRWHDHLDGVDDAMWLQEAALEAETGEPVGQDAHFLTNKENSDG
jgi:hypothetical protein